MQLTTFTDFSIRTLLFLASCEPKKLIPLKEIEDYFNTPRNHLTKVIQQLVQKGFVLSTRGPKGGVCLAQDPDTLYLGHVVIEMEPQMDVLDCSKHPCPLDGGCFVKGVLNEAQESFIQSLDKYSLSDLLKGQHEGRGVPKHALFS